MPRATYRYAANEKVDEHVKSVTTWQKLHNRHKKITELVLCESVISEIQFLSESG